MQLAQDWLGDPSALVGSSGKLNGSLVGLYIFVMYQYMFCMYVVVVAFVVFLSLLTV